MESIYHNNVPQFHFEMHDKEPWTYSNESAADPIARPASATRNYNLTGIGGGMSLQVDTMHIHSPFLEPLEFEQPQYSTDAFHSERKPQEFTFPPFEPGFTGDNYHQQDSPRSDDSSQNCDTFSSCGWTDDLHPHAVGHRLSVSSPLQMQAPYYGQDNYQEDWNLFSTAQSPQLPPGGGSSCGISMDVVQNIPDQLFDQNQDFPQEAVYSSDLDGEGESDHEYVAPPAHPHIHEHIHLSSRRTTRHELYDVTDSTSESFDPEEGEEDADYNPRTGPRVAKARRASGTRRASQHTRRGSNGTNAGRVTKSKKKNTTAKTDRPFPCPLAQYGCKSTFTSKNEWKRHVSTQHIKLGFWRCDMCVISDPQHPVHNDFNRKDLFTQHLRRMHRQHPYSTAVRSASKPTRDENGDLEISEEAIAEHQVRCYKVLRQNPQQSHCLFLPCNKTFSGESSWEERMEHVGAHMERDRKAGKPVPTYEEWREDTVLRDYLHTEGLIDWDGESWGLGNGVPRRVEDAPAQGY